MSYELKPITEAGKLFVEATEKVIKKLQTRADKSDKSSSINKKNISDMLNAGVSTAFVPQALGGFGLTSIHDWIVGLSRLGQGDGSVAIAMNMHLAVCRGMMETWKAAQSSANEEIVAQMETNFKEIVSGNMYICATATEPGTDNLHPYTKAIRVDGGWCINGTKIFVTGSPVASHVVMNLRVSGEKSTKKGGDDVLGSAMIPLATKGIRPQDDWQAMGMRASGSQTILFDNVFVPEPMVRFIGPWGRWSTSLLMNRNLSNLPLLGVFLGIAEHANQLALASAMKKTKTGKPRNAERPSIQHMIGEMEISLSTAQAMISQMGKIADDFLIEYQDQKIPVDRAHELLKDHQSMKWVVNSNAINIVSRAMDVVGGSGYMDKNPLSRLYRDVRAGPFMQPYSPTEAREYIGKVMLKIYPED